MVGRDAVATTDGSHPWLSAHERALIDAIACRLVPADEHGPGARELGAVRYVELALGSAYEPYRAAYVEGLRAIDEWARSERGAGFCDLTEQDQDAVLALVEAGDSPETTARDFFELLRLHVLEGVFGDPAWGGNVGGAGWDLLGYPGPRKVWREEDQALDVKVPRAPLGLAAPVLPDGEPA